MAFRCRGRRRRALGGATVNDRPSDAALWASVAETLRDTVLPNVTDPYVRSTTIHLIALATYAISRGNDPSSRRLDELAAAIGPAAGPDVLRSCVEVLADPHHRAHGLIREILERHLDDDLQSETVLLEAFRGQVPGG